MKQIATIILVVGCTFSAIADNIPKELKNLQSTRAKKIKEIDDAYIKALEKLKVKYTKRGDLESANAIKAELLKLNGMPPPEKAELTSSSTSIDGRHAKISAEVDFSRFKEGSKLFADHSSSAAFIPDDIDDYNFGCGKFHYPNDTYKFTVKKSGIVTLASDSKSLKSQLVDDGWQIVGEAKRTSHNSGELGFSILQKVLPEGEYSFPVKGQRAIYIRILQRR